MALLAGAPAASLAQKNAARDSAYARMRAVQALRQYEYGMRLLWEMNRLPPEMIGRATGYCEMNVADYCYGPKNGGVSYGGFGTRAASPRFRVRKFEPGLGRRFNFLFNRYRDSLIKIHRIIPGDRFVLGEMVRLPLERSNYIGGMENLMRCKADNWYCTALKAYLTDIAGSPIRADTIWTSVLPHIPTHERCYWLDASWVSSDPGFYRSFEKHSCGDRERISRRVWWLSDPLWSGAGNERLSAHLTRNVELLLIAEYRRADQMTPAMVLRSAAPPRDSSMLWAIRPEVMKRYAPWTVVFGWGFDELVMRAGPPHFWVGSPDGQVAQYPHPRVSFVPHGRIFENHLDARPGDWLIDDPWAFEFMIGWNTPFRGIESQIAFFRRGQSVRVVAASDVSADSVLRPARLDPKIILQKDFDLPMRQFRGSDGPVYRFAFDAPHERTMVSIELTSRGAVGRTRFAAGPSFDAGPISLSDILIIQPETTPPSSLSAAERLAFGTTRYYQNSNVGLFWEEYGLARGDEPDIDIIVTPTRVGGLGGLIRNLVGAGPSDSVVVRFRESPASGDAIQPRSVNLSLAGLRPGNYSLSLAVRLPGRAPVVARREISLIQRPRT
jgi:hypothetical protein